jgi:hypothetical protein
MSVRTRLIFLFLAFIVLLAIGRSATGDFNFLLNQFWFTSGFFLLLLLSLIDQPHFSKDPNIFINATVAWVSLLLVPTNLRSGVWWGFFIWSSYLIVSSYILMWVRRTELRGEPVIVQTISRINREIGRPEAIFSAFFLWGCIQQFGINSPKLNSLFLFWAVFMILNLPAFASALDTVFSRSRADGTKSAGVLLKVVSPRIADVEFASELPTSLVGRIVDVRGTKGELFANAVVIDDRVLADRRLGRLAITRMEDAWQDVGSSPGGSITVDLTESISETDGSLPVSVVDSGSEIGKMVFYVHPDQELQAGEVLWAIKNDSTKAFYQIISALVCQMPMPDGNHMHTVKVTAGQLGVWGDEECRFEPITWVVPAGHLVQRVLKTGETKYKIPVGNEIVGRIPNSTFPVHVSVEDSVTHNTALIGVTGSGKSYLAFHLIEAMVKRSIKVMILDISRQHDLYLTHLTPTALKTVADVKPWLEGRSPIGIHQFGVDKQTYPKATADFVEAAYAELSKTKLERGKNIPARLCVVFEEAHSLIPEWNQVANEGDKNQVNKTARVILQGRKYGIGSLIITQRTANVTKTILNQCNTIFALQSFDQTGLDFLKNYLGEEYAHAISTLPTRHAIIVGKASSSARPVIVAVEDMEGRWDEGNTQSATTTLAEALAETPNSDEAGVETLHDLLAN